MNTGSQHEQQGVISLLAEKKVKALLSSGIQMEAELAKLVSDRLSAEPPGSLVAEARDHDLLRRHTHYVAPTQTGLYLKLLHGRPSPDSEMTDWGTDGPWIGPLESFHCLYLSDIGMTFTGGEELVPASPYGAVVPPIYVYAKLIYHEGIYYGDFELHNI